MSDHSSPDPSAERPNSRETEYEDVKLPKDGDQPPRTASEPAGSEGSSNSSKTKTDPASGEQDSGNVGPAELRDTPKVG
jgi:hypothetical protein